MKVLDSSRGIIDNIRYPCPGTRHLNSSNVAQYSAMIDEYGIHRFVQPAGEPHRVINVLSPGRRSFPSTKMNVYGVGIYAIYAQNATISGTESANKGIP